MDRRWWVWDYTKDSEADDALFDLINMLVVWLFGLIQLQLFFVVSLKPSR